MARNNRGFLTAASLRAGERDQWAKQVDGKVIAFEIGHDSTGIIGTPYFVKSTIGDAVNYGHYEQLNEARRRFRTLVRKYK